MAQAAFTLIFRKILPDGPWTQLSAFTAHQVVALPLMFVLTYIGWRDWFFDPNKNDPFVRICSGNSYSIDSEDAFLVQTIQVTNDEVNHLQRRKVCVFDSKAVLRPCTQSMKLEELPELGATNLAILIILGWLPGFSR